MEEYFLNFLEETDENKNVFIGRREKLNEIEKAFYDGENVINVYGVGGIGKTTFLSELKNIFESKGVNVFKYDLSNFIGVEKFYEDIYVKLYEKGVKAYYFFMVFYIYWQKKHPNESFSDYRENKSVANNILSFLTQDLGIIVNTFLPVDITNLNKVFRNFKNFALRAGLNKEALEFIENLQNKEAYEIERYLPIFLGMDLERNGKTVFLFDTYERLFEKSVTKNTDAQDWIKNFISFVGKVAFIVVSGRERIDFQNECKYIHLEDLSEEESEKLVKKLGVKEEGIVKKIVFASKGHPFYIALAVDMYKKNRESFDTEIIKKERIFNRFIQSLTENDIQKLEILSVARIFDVGMFKYIYGKNYSDIIFRELLSFSFFARSGEFFYMHELMRESFILRMSPERKKELHRYMFEYFYRKGRENLDRLCMKEAVYHLTGFAGFDDVKKWYESISEDFERKGEYEFLIDLFKEGFLMCADNKAYFLIKEALVGLEIKNYKILNYVISMLPFVKMDSEYLGAYYYLRRKQEYLFHKKLPFKKRKDFFDYLRNKYKNLELKIKDPDIKTLFLIDNAKFHSKYENGHQYAKTILLKALKIVKSEFLKVKILDNLAKIELKMNNNDKALEIALNSLEIKRSLFENGHIQFAISYELLSRIYQYIDASKMMDNLLLSISVYRKYYNKWHSKIKNLYIRFVLEVDEDFVLKNGLETDLYYLMLLNRFVQKNFPADDILSVIEKLRKASEEKNRTDTEILKLLISNSKSNPEYKIIAENLIETVLSEYESAYEKRNIYFGLYQAFAKIKNLEEAEKYILKVEDISENSLEGLYVSAIVEIIRFYKYEKKDYLKTKAYYEKLVGFQKGYRKVITLLKYCSFVKEEDLKLELLQKAYDEVKKGGDIYQINEVLEGFAEFYKKKNVKDKKILDIYIQMADNFEKIGDYVRVDKVYGMIAEYYYQKKEYAKVLEYYDSQIEIRKRFNDVNKLVKGYRFKADLYLESGNDENAVKYYEKALELVEETEVEVFTNISLILVKLYKKLGLEEKAASLLEERIKRAESYGDEKYMFFAYELKLQNEFKKEPLKTLGLFKTYLNSLNLFRYKKDLIIKYLKDIGKIDENYANDLMFFLYENFLLSRDFNRAEKSFYNLKKYFKKYPAEKYRTNFKNIAKKFLNASKYETTIRLIRDYQKIFNESFLDDPLFCELPKNKIYAIFYELKKASMFDEALRAGKIIYEFFNENGNKKDLKSIELFYKEHGLNVTGKEKELKKLFKI
ncbi:hypothetical protein [Nautilia sp.]